MSSVITVRVPTEMKKELEKYGVQVGKVTRNALEAELQIAKRKKLEEAARSLQEVFSTVSEEQLIEWIREDREKR